MYMGIFAFFFSPKPAENKKITVGGDLRLAVIAGTFRAFLQFILLFCGGGPILTQAHLEPLGWSPIFVPTACP